MKNQTLQNSIFLCVLLLMMSACSKNEDSNPSLTIALNPDTYQTQLYTSGQTEPLSMSSDNVASTIVTIDGNPEYLQYNEDTQRISWTKALPLGETIATLRAVNGELETATEFSIENSFEGDFHGGNNDTDSSDAVSDNMNFSFDSNGTFSLTWQEAQYTGVYYVDGSHVVMSLDFSETSSRIFEGQLVYSLIKTPSISGDWYENTIAPENRLGYFEIILVQ